MVFEKMTDLHNDGVRCIRLCFFRTSWNRSWEHATTKFHSQTLYYNVDIKEVDKNHADIAQ